MTSSEGDVHKVQRALAHGLFGNAVRFEKTEYSDKDRVSADVYRLVQNSGPGKPLSVHCSPPLRQYESQIVGNA